MCWENDRSPVVNVNTWRKRTGKEGESHAEAIQTSLRIHRLQTANEAHAQFEESQFKIERKLNLTDKKLIEWDGYPIL